MVQLYGVHQDSRGDTYLITEYMSEGDLLNFLRKRRLFVSWQHKMNMYVIDDMPQVVSCYTYIHIRIYIPFTFYFRLKDVACGMEYLSSCGIVHRDLSARNLLLRKVSDVRSEGECKHFHSP